MYYLQLFRCLDQHEVRYLLVGGLAMNLLGVPRLTMDVDIVLALDEVNLQGFLHCARTLGLAPRVPEPLEALLSPDRRRVWMTEKRMIAYALTAPAADAPSLDVLLDHPLDLADAFARAVRREAGGVPIWVASVDDMISLKRAAGRRQDLSDIEHLLRLRGEGP